MELLHPSIAILTAYLIGAIPFGLVFSRGMGVDIRTSGSGNIGATNVSRLLGKKIGFLTLVADAAKAIIPMVVANWYYQDLVDTELWVVLCGGAAFVGHLFPVYLLFKGGKGVATALGIFLYLQPVAVLISVAVFAASVYFSGFVSVGSLLASALIPLWIYLLKGSALHIALAMFISMLIWVRHHENIVRLFNNTEKSWKKTPEKPKTSK